MSDQPGKKTESSKKPDQSNTAHLLNMTVRRAIFTLAWPTFLTMLLFNTASTVDMIMVGRLGAVEFAAVGISNRLYWFFALAISGMEVSIVAIVARHMGAGNPERAGSATGQAVILSIIVSLVVGSLVYVFASSLLDVFGVEPEVHDYSVVYIRILCSGIVFIAVMFILAGALRGAGDARTPMFIGAVESVFNLVLNYGLIFGKFGLPALGVKGAALATVISWIIPAVLFIALLFSGRLRITLSLKDFAWSSSRSWQIIKLALPTMVERIGLQTGMLFFTKLIVGFGTLTLSGYQVGMQVLSLSFIPNTGFEVAASTLIGQNLGANQKGEALKAGWLCVLWGLVCMCVLGLLYLFLASPIAAIFIKEASVIEIAASYIRVIAVCQLGMAIYFTLSGALRGAGDTRSPLVITLMGMYGCRIPAAILMVYYFHTGVGAVFSLLIFDYLVRTIGVVIQFQRGKWQGKKI